MSLQLLSKLPSDVKAHQMLMDEGKMAAVECDGDGVCLKCVCSVKSADGKAVKMESEEKSILSGNGYKSKVGSGDQNILACFHSVKAILGLSVTPKFPDNSA